VNAVDGVSFTVPEGICFGLLGPNGAGKTTTIEIMEGILRPTSGEVLYRGELLGTRFREEAGILFQKTALQDFLQEHFEEVLLELPKQDLPDEARALVPKVFDSIDRVEIATQDLEGTLRTLIDARASLEHLRIRPPNLEDLFLDLTGKELRA
jgi:ABC-type oligopeptide transport system ATPase subunit